MSLRNRLTFFSVLFLAISLLVIGSGLYFYERTILINGVSDDLQRATNRFQSQYSAAALPLERFYSNDDIEVTPNLPAEDFEGSPISVAVYKETGVRLASSRSFMGSETANLRSVDLREDSVAWGASSG